MVQTQAVPVAQPMVQTQAVPAAQPMVPAQAWNRFAAPASPMFRPSRQPARAGARRGASLRGTVGIEFEVFPDAAAFFRKVKAVTYSSIWLL